MYKVFISLVFLLLPFVHLNAQVSISVQEPPPGIVQKTQLWNLSLINSGNNTINVTIGITIVDINDNQPLLTAFSRSISVAKGVKLIRIADVSPIDYTYVSAGFNRLADAFLPVGNYRVCYAAYTIEKETEEVLAENCISIEVQPLSPPQLTMPQDSASLQNPYPQFSWLPPAPLTLFSDLNYELLVTEVRSDQTAGAAIQENIPIYNARRLNTVANNYPSSWKSLDTGKVYAWRIIAKNGENFAAQSDVWTFRITKEKQDKLTPARNAYIELKGNNPNISTGVIPDNILGIKYYSYDKSHETLIRFLNGRGETVKEIKKMIDYGNNFLVFRLDNAFAKETTYFIEITDLQTTIHRASFRMSN
ncbi:MAG: hypothetical protein IT249_19525 [Chitinophagaceae bacterium]|nr:hypothetical protein [Chitinophagaceae bacterium]